MNVQEKQAWFILAIFGLTLISFLISCLVIYSITGGFNWAAFGTLGIFGLAGLGSLIGRKDRKEGNVILDERDEEIGRKATIIGYSIFWIAFVAAGMLPFFILGPNTQVTLPTTAFSIFIVAGLTIIFTVRSLAIVIMYRRDTDVEKE